MQVVRNTFQNQIVKCWGLLDVDVDVDDYVLVERNGALSMRSLCWTEKKNTDKRSKMPNRNRTATSKINQWQWYTRSDFTVKLRKYLKWHLSFRCEMVEQPPHFVTIIGKMNNWNVFVLYSCGSFICLFVCYALFSIDLCTVFYFYAHHPNTFLASEILLLDGYSSENDEKDG